MDTSTIALSALAFYGLLMAVFVIGFIFGLAVMLSTVIEQDEREPALQELDDLLVDDRFTSDELLS